MRALLIATAVLAVLAAPAQAADKAYRVIKSSGDFFTAVDNASVRKKGTGAVARIVGATRFLDNYTVQTVEYDCTWMKMRILAYDSYRADGALVQTYRNADWMGALDRETRAFLCTGQGGVTDVSSPSDHALGKAWLARTLPLP